MHACALGPYTPVAPESRGKGLLHMGGRRPRQVRQALIDLNCTLACSSVVPNDMIHVVITSSLCSHEHCSGHLVRQGSSEPTSKTVQRNRTSATVHAVEHVTFVSLH